MKKKILAVIAAIVLSFTVFAGGCLNGLDGRDGKSLNIYDIYDAVNVEREAEGLESLTFLEFIEEYLSYSQDDIETVTALQSTINRSVLSSVSILTRFAYTYRVPSYGGQYYYSTTYSVFCGSGVIIDLDKESGDAIVVTNCHVVYDYSSDSRFCQDVRLYLYGQDVNGVNYTISTDGSISNDQNYCIPATVIGASITYDIAVLKVEGSEVLKRSDATTASFCDDETVNVGESVYAVGNGSGEGIAATSGIISRDSEEIYLNLKDTDNDSDYLSYRVLRTDAAINGGNSGGGLFNTKGEIVGIVNAKTVDEEIDNMSYALPASTVKRVVQLLIDSAGTERDFGLSRALIGITTQTTDIYSQYNQQKGAVEVYETIKVVEITTGAAAAQGGLKANDVLVNIAVGSGTGSSFNARESVAITRDYCITNALLAVRLNDTVKITVERNGENTDVYFTYDNPNYFIHEI